MNALWRLAAYRPDLLVAHLASYGALLQDDGARSMQGLQRRLVGLAVVLASFTVALALAGVAVLLWAVSPTVAPPRAWLLLAVPLVPVVLGVAVIRRLQRLAPLPLWQACRQQWARDQVLWRDGAGS